MSGKVVFDVAALCSGMSVSVRGRGCISYPCSAWGSGCSAAPGRLAALGTPTPRGEARYGRMTTSLGVQCSLRYAQAVSVVSLHIQSAIALFRSSVEFSVAGSLPYRGSRTEQACCAACRLPVHLPSEVHLPPHVGRTLNFSGGVPILGIFQSNVIETML